MTPKWDREPDVESGAEPSTAPVLAQRHRSAGFGTSGPPALAGLAGMIVAYAAPPAWAKITTGSAVGLPWSFVFFSIVMVCCHRYRVLRRNNKRWPGSFRCRRDRMDGPRIGHGGAL